MQIRQLMTIIITLIRQILCGDMNITISPQEGGGELDLSPFYFLSFSQVFMLIPP